MLKCDKINTVQFFTTKKKRYPLSRRLNMIKRSRNDRKEESQAPEESDTAGQKAPPFKVAAFLLLLSVVFLLCGLDKYNLKETSAGFLCFAFSLITFLLFLSAVIIGIKDKRKR